MNLEEIYLKKSRQYKKIMLILILFILFFLPLACSFGINVKFYQLFSAINSFISGTLGSDPDKEINAIILSIRLPRLILAVLSGFALAISGSLMQTITRNYLVSPFTVGVSAAAAFGASLGIILGAKDINVIIPLAFATALICMIILYGASYIIGISPSIIILIGISLNYLFGAFTELLKFGAKGRQLESIIQWSFGTLNRASWSGILILWIIMIVCIPIIFHYIVGLGVMAYNPDNVSRSLGINTKKIRIIIGLVSILLTATVICFTGVIGFVGLIAPHMARLIISADYKYSVILSALIGSTLMLVSDTIGHYIFPPNDIPVSIILSFIGVPLFIHLIVSGRSKI